MSIILENPPTVLEDEDLSDSWLQFDDYVVFRNTLSNEVGYGPDRFAEKGSTKLFDRILRHLLKGDPYTDQGCIIFTFTNGETPINLNLNAIKRITGGLKT